MGKFLLVEDDTTFSMTLEGFLKKKHHEVDVAMSLKSAKELLSKEKYDILLLDYRLPDGTGIEVLAAARAHNNTCPAIIMTSFNDVRTAVTAMRSGAFDYITKPVNPDEFLLVVNEALAKKETPADNKPYQTAEAVTHTYIGGTSSESKKLEAHMALVAGTDMSVIIEGESGTGKEFAARSIHAQSLRSNKPFIAIDCGALSKDLAGSELFGHVKGAFTGALTDKKGVFEFANGGTLFMDEVGNLSYDIQVKLLRALQERTIQPLGSNKLVKVDIRILTATNENLAENIANGSFREDLYHRLNEFKIHIPPLRQRAQDLKLFVKHFISVANKELSRRVETLSPEVWQAFENYDWPGNLRELKNVVRRMVLLTPGTTAEKQSLPDEMFISVSRPQPAPDSDLKALREFTEKEQIIKTLEEVRYNKAKAARLLNVDRKTLYSKMERYGIK